MPTHSLYVKRNKRKESLMFILLRGTLHISFCLCFSICFTLSSKRTQQNSWEHFHFSSGSKRLLFKPNWKLLFTYKSAFSISKVSKGLTCMLHTPIHIQTYTHILVAAQRAGWAHTIYTTSHMFCACVCVRLNGTPATCS